jgi:hypothetical protein
VAGVLGVELEAVSEQHKAMRHKLREEARHRKAIERWRRLKCDRDRLRLVTEGDDDGEA